MRERSRRSGDKSSENSEQDEIIFARLGEQRLGGFVDTQAPVLVAAGQHDVAGDLRQPERRAHRARADAVARFGKVRQPLEGRAVVAGSGLRAKCR